MGCACLYAFHYLLHFLQVQCLSYATPALSARHRRMRSPQPSVPDPDACDLRNLPQVGEGKCCPALPLPLQLQTEDSRVGWVGIRACARAHARVARVKKVVLHSNGWFATFLGCVSDQETAGVAVQNNTWEAGGPRAGFVTLDLRPGASATVESAWIPTVAGAQAPPDFVLLDCAHRELAGADGNAVVVHVLPMSAPT